MEALAAFKRSDEENRAAQWIFCTSSIGGCSEMYFRIHLSEPFEVEGRGSSVGVVNRSKLEIDVYGVVVRSQTWEGAPFAYGS